MADETKEPVRWEVSKKTGNKRPVYKDAAGKEYYGEVVKATAAKTEAKKQSASEPMVFDEGKVQVPYGMDKAYTPIGVKNLNKYMEEYGMDPLPENASKEQIKAAAGKLQQLAIEKNPSLVEHYMKERNPKPNAKLEQMLGSKGYGKTNADLKKAVADGKISPEEIRNAYKDDQWWFRALTTEKKRLPRKEYEEKMKQQGAIKQGDKTFFGDDPTRPYVYTEYEPIDEEPKKDIKVVDKEVIPGVRPDIRRNPPVEVGKKTYAPWWLQDIVKTSGAAADLARVKKYLPWQDKPEVFLPKATYYDPTRELAANTEQANLASQFHQAFTGPKSGAISGVQGKAFDNAANIMAKYNNLNVGLANQLSQERASILNQASQNQAGLNTQLWDKYTIANQQFDNSKNMARQNLRQSYMDAITNRAKTQALNTLYPNYYTDPSRGGFVNFNPGYGPIHANAPGDDFAQQQKIMERFPGTTFKEADDAVNKTKKSDTEAKDNFDPYLRAQGYQNT